jgi:hypothetical protein
MPIGIYKRKTTPVHIRFWKWVEKGPGCWLWTGAASHGYGRIRSNGLTIRATVVAWEIGNGAPFPKGMWCLHKCDNPMCVRPDHLYPGVPMQNTADMTARGRAKFGANKARGTKHHSAKLTPARVRSIRVRHAAGDSLASLARRYGVHWSCVSSVIQGRTWKEVR